MNRQGSSTIRVAARARSRYATASLIMHLGRWMLLMAAVAVVVGSLVTYGFGRTLGLVAVGSLLTAGVAVALVRTLTVRRSLVESAAAVDRTLGLKDRISSGLELSQPMCKADPSFAALAIRDAETAASSVRVERAVPVQFGNTWVLWPLLSLIAVAAALYLPMAGNREKLEEKQTLSNETRIAISKAAEAIEASRDEQLSFEEADQQVLAQLREIEDELLAGRRGPDQAAAESAAVLEARARELEEDARRVDPSAMAEMLDEQLRAVAPGELGRATELAEALRDTDFEAAQRVLQELIESSRMLPDIEREQLADDLRRLSEMLDPEGQDLREHTTSAPDESLADPDRPHMPELPEETDEFSSREFPEETQSPPDQNQDQDLSDTQTPAEQDESTTLPEDAQSGDTPPSPADQALEEHRREQQAQEERREQARETAKELSRNLRETAEQIERGEEGQKQDSSADEPIDRQESDSQQQERESTQDADAESGEQPENQQTQERQESERESREIGQVGREQQEQGEETGEGLQPQDGAGDEAEGLEELDSASPEGELDSRDAIDRALDQLERLSDQQRDAMRKAEQSQSMREMAKELLNRASPEQQERMAELARRFARDFSPDEPIDGEPLALESEPVDMRDRRADDDAGRHIGDIAPTMPPEGLPAMDPSALAGQVRDAAASAERAIEGQAIPRRYRDFVRSVYRRYEDRTQRAIAAPEGRDADAPPSRAE